MISLTRQSDSAQPGLVRMARHVLLSACLALSCPFAATAGEAAVVFADFRSAAGEATRGWGFLPERDRDEIIQGFEETFMSKYREQIERYYRLLAREEGE